MESRANLAPVIAAVVLAAGESTRMRELKALLPWVDGRSLLRYQVETLAEAGYGPIVVVLGHRSAEVAAALEDDPDSARPQPVEASTERSRSGRTLPRGSTGSPRAEISLVLNDRYQEGRATSIVTGVRNVPLDDADAILVSSVDQPRSLALYATLRESWQSEQPLIAVPSLGGKPGHPPLFDASLVDELLMVTERNQGLREVMARHRDERLLVPVDDPLTLTNLNTREDYEAALLAVG